MADQTLHWLVIMSWQYKIVILYTEMYSKKLSRSFIDDTQKLFGRETIVAD